MDQSTALPAGAAPAQPRKRPFLSPLNQRRWQNFKANRRGYWSLWLFLILFVASLFAEFIANDKPILVSYKGQYLTPIFKTYSKRCCFPTIRWHCRASISRTPSFRTRSPPETAG
jgi:ABC-type antimicrobial peptide transport system permease subunit